MTATDTRRQPAKRSAGGGSPHRARCEIRLWRTGGEDRCGLRFPGGHGPQLAACRHEQTASFMAAAISRLTGTRGVLAVTSGSGDDESHHRAAHRQRRAGPRGGVVRRRGSRGPAQTNPPIHRRRRGDEDRRQVHRRDHRPGQCAGGGGERVPGRHHDAARRGLVAILPREVLDAPTPAGCCWKRSGLAHVD